MKRSFLFGAGVAVVVLMAYVGHRLITAAPAPITTRLSAPRTADGSTEPAVVAQPLRKSANAGNALTTKAPPSLESHAGKSPEQIFATSHDFPADYQTLLAGGDPDGLYYAAEMLGVCRSLYDPATGQFVEPEGVEAPKKLNALSDRADLARRTLVARCAGWIGHLPMGSEARDLRMRAAEANSPVGKAFLLSSLIEQGKNNEAAAIASEVLRKQDGYAFPMLAPVLSDPAGVWKIGEHSEAVPGNLIDSVLQLASCDFGRDCNSESTEILYSCATTGYCPRTLRDWVLENPSLLPGEREQIERYASIVVSAIRSDRLDHLGIPPPRTVGR